MALAVYEDSLEASTATLEPSRPRRYVSVEHAVTAYLEIAIACEGCPGLDPERMAMNVQSDPAPENPHLVDVDEKQELEEIFEHVKSRVSERYWRIWQDVRVFHLSLREAEAEEASRQRKEIAEIDLDIGLRRWARRHNYSPAGPADELRDRLMGQCGPSKTQVATIRDRVDGRLEEHMWVAGKLVRDPVRDEESEWT